MKLTHTLAVVAAAAASSSPSLASSRISHPTAMGSMDAEVEIDMEISDDEGVKVVDGRGVKRSASLDKSDSSRKRKRSSLVDTSPSVRVEYHNLSRESRKKLQEVLRDWSLWEGYRSRHVSPEQVKNHVESGEEKYYPAMQVGPVGNSFSVTFWVDKPAKQARSKESGDIRGISRTSSEDLRENEADVPLYDRVIPSLSSSDSSKEGVLEVEREAVRCFNCGSYSHALRECKRQWNHEAINSARSNHAAKRSFSSGPRSATRYYETPHTNENQEPDRSPWQPSQGSEHGLSRSNSLCRSTPDLLKKLEKSNRPTSKEENEEGEIMEGVATPRDEEELYMAFSPDPPSAEKATPDRNSSGVRVPYSSPPERMWRSPASAYSPSPPSHLHPVYHHQRSFGYSPPNHVYPHTTPPLAHYNGVHAQRSRDERQPQLPWDVERQPQNRAWDERSQPQSRAWDERPQPHRSPWEDSRIPYHPETSVGPAPVSVPSAPIPIPTAKEDDEWELNFESSVHQSESNSRVSPPGLPDHYSTPTPNPGLTINTASLGFSAPDPSQLSPTGSGYGESFRPSPAPQPPVQYHFSYHTTPGREPTSYSTEAWEKAQAALSDLQSDGAQGGS